MKENNKVLEKLNRQIDEPSRKESNALLVVVIGASAGGLEACRELLEDLPSGNVCYIFCQHLSPSHESLLKIILSRQTELEVCDIHNDRKLEAGKFYVPTPSYDIEIEALCLKLKSPRPSSLKTPSPNINRLLSSVAKHCGANAIAVILSGSGKDGALGLTELKDNGGLAFVQTPDSSRYESMPEASIATHRADFIGDPKEIGQAITRVSQGQGLEFEQDTGDIYESILEFVARKTKIDFSGYRKSSLLRRLTRRMHMLNIRSMEVYCEYLNKNPEEAERFVQSSFVVVSEFYRDVDAFNALNAVLIDYLKTSVDRDILRIWVAGCATGEEVYTLAMLLEEVAVQFGKIIPYKILATDLSHEALSVARKGEYERNKLVNVSSSWLNAYFEEGDGFFKVHKYIRDRIVFSHHDVLTDPPFSNIHLVSCRNLLIYFDNDVQKQILATFLYSIIPDGLLFLGAAENCNEKSMFTAIDEKQRIYKRNRQAKYSPKLRQIRQKGAEHRQIKRVSKIDEQHARLYQALVEGCLQNVIVLNEDNHIVYKRGAFDLMLSNDGGFSDTGIFGELQPEYRAKMRALIFKARQNKSSTENIVIGAHDQSLSVSVSPLGGDFKSWYILEFNLVKVHDESTLVVDQDSDTPKERVLLKELDRELMETRESLQVVIEELESTNEQLQIYNEELQSSNEEYQSTNEELQTVNEELQSTNEELLTTNEEYANQSQLFQRLTNDLTNIQESIEIPLILISLDLRIKRFTSSCDKIFDTSNIHENDLIIALEWFCESQFIMPLIESVKDRQRPCVGEVLINDRDFECRVSLYLNDNKEIDGYILVFYETSQYKRSQRELEKEKFLAQQTVETIMEGVMRVNNDLCVEYANPMSCAITGWSEQQLIGMPISRVLRVFSDQEECNLEKVLQASIDNNEMFKTNDEPLLLKTRRGKDVYIDISFSPSNGTQADSVNVLAFRDVSQRHEHVKTLMWTSTHDALTGLINRKEMEKRIDHAIVTSKRNKVNSTFMFIDLDQFKVVNDTCGHQAGDLMLQQLAQMMIDMLRSRDTLARLGGDEFGLLLEKCPLLESESIAIKLQKAINDYRFIYDEKTFRVGASIGIAEISPDVNQVSELLKDADAACFLAKETGRNRIEIHTTANDALIEKRIQMSALSDINEAIEENGFRLYFQEISDLNDESKNRWEVLIRMFKRDGEFLLPNAFLPAAERFGIITQIDMWLLSSLFERLSSVTKLKDVDDLPFLNINISGATIGNEEYLTSLQSKIEESGYDPEKICIELTETAAISQFVKAKSFIEKIRDIGCRFALDDFGRGMSSLSYLRDLPLDVVKIDSSFVKNIGSDDVDNVIVKSVVSVSHLLNMEVIAEGVEEEVQLECLRALDVQQVQGYLLSKPVPFEEFASNAFQNTIH